MVMLSTRRLILVHVSTTGERMHLNVLKTYAKELGESISGEELQDDTITTLLMKGIELFNGTEKSSNWKLMCHMVQALASFVAQTLASARKVGSINEAVAQRLARTALSAFRSPYMQCIKDHLPDQQFVGVYGPLYSAVLALHCEWDTALTDETYTQQMSEVVSRLENTPKISVYAFSVIRPPRPESSQSVSSMALRIQALCSCTIAMLQMEADMEPAEREKHQMKRREALRSLASWLYCCGQPGGCAHFLDGLCRHEELQQQLKLSMHAIFLQNALKEPSDDLSYLYRSESERQTTRMWWTALSTLAAQAHGQVGAHTDRDAVIQAVRGQLLAVDEAQAKVAFESQKRGAVSKTKKSAHKAAPAGLTELCEVAAALRLWVALVQLMSVPPTDAGAQQPPSSSGSCGSEDLIAPQAAAYLDAAMVAVRALFDAVAGEHKTDRAIVLTVCDTLVQVLHPLMSSLFMAGKFKDQEWVIRAVGELCAGCPCAALELQDIVRRLRNFCTMTVALNGVHNVAEVAAQTLPCSSGTLTTESEQKNQGSSIAGYHDAVAALVVVGATLLASDDDADRQALLNRISAGTSPHLPKTRGEFMELAKAAYQACSMAAKRAGKDAAGASCDLIWVCVVAARVLALVYCDPSTALTWTGYASSAAHKCIHPLYARDKAVALMEAVLLRAELYEHTGNLDGAIVYLREATTMAQALHSPAMCKVVALHTLRIWHRSASPKLHALVDELVGAGSEQIYSSTWQLSDELSKLACTTGSTLDALFCLRPDEDRTARVPNVKALNFRHQFRYWDTAVASDGDGFHTFAPADVRRHLHTLYTSSSAGQELSLSGLPALVNNAGFMVGHKELTAVSSTGAFDAVREVRRRMAFQKLHNAEGDPFTTFISGASSCGVSAESLGDSADSAGGSDSGGCNAAPSTSTLSHASTCITQTLTGTAESAEHICNALQSMLHHCDAVRSGADGSCSSSALCFMTTDKSTNSVLIGRMDSTGRVLVAALPMEDRLSHLLQRWDELQERNQAMLRQGLDPALVAQVSDEQKRAWWAARQRYDADIESCMSDLQDLLGPWRVLLSTGPCGGAAWITEDTVCAAVQGAASGGAKTKNSKAAKGSAATQTSVTTALRNAVPWLQLIVENTASAGTETARTMLLTAQEAESAIASILSRLPDAHERTTGQVTEIARNLLDSRSVVGSTNSTSTAAKEIKAVGSPLPQRAGMSEEKLNSLKVTELRVLLKDAGLDAAGKKQDLVDRLMKHHSDNVATPSQTVSNSGAESVPATADLGSAGVLDRRGHLVLVLDEQLQRLPVEVMPALRSASCSRVPSFALLLKMVHDATSSSHKGTAVTESLQKMDINSDNQPGKRKPVTAKSKTTVAKDASAENKENITHDGHTVDAWRPLSAEKGWYALDIEGNLPATRQTLQPFLDRYSEQWAWKRVVATVPAEDTTRELHESSDLFIFCGHGAGERMHDTFRLRKFTSCPASLLWGCSSGRLKARGVHDAVGTALYYLIAGAPFLVANLWDVTDKDIDKLCMAHMKLLLPGGSTDQDAGSQDGRTDKVGQVVDAATALANSRNVCRMPFAVGAAPVVYGIPALLTAANA